MAATRVPACNRSRYSVSNGLFLNDSWPELQTAPPGKPFHKRMSRQGDAVFATSRAVTQEVVGTHVLLTRSPFGGGILRKLLLRVSLEKPTSAPLRF